VYNTHSLVGGVFSGWRAMSSSVMTSDVVVAADTPIALKLSSPMSMRL
jgi:hypothetical protein